MDHGADVLTGRSWVFGGVTLCLVLLLYLVYVVRQRRRSEGRLEKTIRSLALGETSARILRELAHSCGDGIPARVLDDRKSFEKAVDAYFSDGPDVASQPSRESEIVAGLRHELGFRCGRSSLIHSTRQLHKGARVRLRPAGGTGKDLPVREARVSRLREDVLELEISDPWDGLEPESTFHATALADTGRYSFETRVIRLDRSGGRCLMRHSVDLKRLERRRFRRVDVREQVYCRGEVNGKGRWQKMQLMDLSVCGAKLLGASLLGGKITSADATGETRRMEMRFCPSDLLPNAETEWNREGEIVTAGAVVRTEKVRRGKFIYRVDFDEMDRDRRELLFRLLYLIETGRRS
jgi:c-di-GMP-binding flagellar brake protein YcgR